MVASGRRMLLRRLEQRDHTRSELLSYLTTRGVSDQVAVELLDRFQEVGLVDDARFALNWVECRIRTGRRSARGVRAELLAKGIAAEIVAEALDSYAPSIELESARAFAARRYRTGPGKDRSHLVRSVSAALGRRGYPAAMCIQVAKETADTLASSDLGGNGDAGEALPAYEDSAGC
jgi:regulatory protein